MSTKSDPKSQFIKSSFHAVNGNQYSNLNLNQNSQCADTFQLESKSNNDKSFGYNKSDGYQESNGTSKSWKEKSMKDLCNKTLAAKLSLNGENDTKNKSWKNISDKNKSSTLSLHITAYENANKSLKKKKEQQQQNLPQKFKEAIIKNCFEYPRQMEGNEKQPSDHTPEVMQFKASQKLLNPNQNVDPAPSEEEYEPPPHQFHKTPEQEEQEFCEYHVSHEFLGLFERLDIEMNHIIDIDVMYRVLCGRRVCNPKLAYLVDRFTEYYMNASAGKALLRDLVFFDLNSDACAVEQRECLWMYDVAKYFGLDSTDTKLNNPVNAVVFSILICLELFRRNPVNVAFRGSFIYLDKQTVQYLKSLPSNNAERKKLFDAMNARYGKEEIKDISALLHHCMSLGLGWLSAGENGIMVNNFVIKTLFIDEMPELLMSFDNYQISQFVFNAICGESDSYAISEYFTIYSEENWETLQNFLSIETEKRVEVFEEYVNVRAAMLLNELICDKANKEFNIIEQKRKNVRENIEDCTKWLKDFSDFVKLD